ncbi:MAG TPA: ribosome small subunit-dependent GTPase A [Candidatus Saccharimonadales bacterium]|nr:ribosome small subunit-dependent GTPase A [Candidatus Saccharimonadales bacterium]
MDTLQAYGWNDSFAASFAAMDMPQCIPARVIADFGSMLKVVTPDPLQVESSGRLLYFAAPHELPKVGDWVAVLTDSRGGGVIEAVIPRRSEIARKATGDKAVKQVMAANIDVAFILQALDNDFSPPRLQRYLYQLHADNITPIVVLNKADKATDIDTYTSALTDIDARYIICSALTGQGMEQLTGAITPGQTAVLLGSSGVGKSTLTNYLLGHDVQRTQAIREIDAKGRHTTTHRELFVLPNGGLLMDMPGIRELQLWGTEEELDENFDDVALLISTCRFSNCGHTTEPGCAIRSALASGELSEAHYANYLKMKRELHHLALKTNAQAARENKKDISKTLRTHYKAIRQSPKHKKH